MSGGRSAGEILVVAAQWYAAREVFDAGAGLGWALRLRGDLAGAESLRDREKRLGDFVVPDALVSLYRHIRAMHGLGIYHGALSWKNVLLGWLCSVQSASARYLALSGASGVRPR